MKHKVIQHKTREKDVVVIEMHIVPKYKTK